MMEPLSAQVFNNQIVAMRKVVRQAVVHQIHSLTKKINKLKMKKGTEEQKLQNSNKAEAYVSEVIILKKCKPDDISLFALSNTEESELKALIAKQVITPETKAKAKLCLHEVIKKCVNTFINKYKGSLELLNDLIDARYNKVDVKKNKANSKQKKPTDKESESDESVPQLVSVSGSSSEESDNSLSEGGLDVESADSDDEQELEVKDPKKPSISKKGSDSTAPEELEENDYSDEEVTTNDENMSDEDSESIASNSENGDADLDFNSKEKIIKQNKGKKQKISNSSFGDKSSGTQIDKHSKKNEKDNKPKQKTVDPFFKTKDDSEYLTFCNLKRDEAGKKAELNEKNDDVVESDEEDSADDFGREDSSLRGGRGSFRGSRGRGSFRGGHERGSFRGGRGRGSFGDRESFRGGRGRGSFRGGYDKESFRGGRGRGSPGRGNDRESFRGGRGRGSRRDDNDRESFRGGRGRGFLSRGNDRESFRGGRGRGSSREGNDKESFRGGRGRGSFSGGNDRESFRGRRGRGSFSGTNDRESSRGGSTRGSFKRYFDQDNDGLPKKKFMGSDHSRDNDSFKQSDKVKLHPSWEAKKNLKPSIASFQGKKVVFDD